MGYFILESVLFAVGLAAFIFGKVPVTRKRRVSGSAARLVGVVLMIPMVLYLIACKQSHVPPLGIDERFLDPLERMAVGFVRLVAMSAAFASFLAAMVFAIVTSEPPRRP
jgi:hypothetical protein